LSLEDTRAPRWGSGLSLALPFGSGSLAFTAPPSTFARHRVGPRGLPSGSGSAERVCGSCPPRLRPLLQRSPSALGLGALLFWLRPPGPLHRLGLERPLPGPLAGPLRSVHCHVADPVPSPRFPTALTACSARALQACFILLPVRGSPCFGLPFPCGSVGSSSRRGSYPSKNAPRQ
jgi:hypothetical protein